MPQCLDLSCADIQPDKTDIQDKTVSQDSQAKKTDRETRQGRQTDRNNSQPDRQDSKTDRQTIYKTVYRRQADRTGRHTPSAAYIVCTVDKPKTFSKQRLFSTAA